MAVRALVIAIESYPAVTVGGIAKHLPGTLQAGLEFKTWLIQKWAAEARPADQTQLLFCSEPSQPGGTGATQRDIRQAISRLKQEGQNSTEELYVFFSGHGFSFVQRPGSRADVVLSSDFESPALSSHCCLNLDEMIAWLRDHLGFGRHFYFVDACRNPLDASQIQIGPLLPIDPNAPGGSTTFVLQSTVEGATAAVGGPFPAALMAGLRGKGKAKTWDDVATDAMFVRYDSLRQFVKTSLGAQPITSRVNGPEGESDGLLATLRPVPLSQCTIQIDNALANDLGELFLKRRRSNADERRPVGSQPLVFKVEPDLYTIALRLQNAAVTPSDPVAVDLFDDRTITFTKLDVIPRGLAPRMMPTPAMMEAASTVDVDIVVPQGVEVLCRHMETGAERRFTESARVSLIEGRYFAVAGKDGHVFERREVNVAAGMAPLNLCEWRTSAPRVAIARQLPASGDGVDFSESLGGVVTDADLDLWLALVGGGRLLGSRGDYSKLSKFPLHDFSNEPAGASPVYLLAGFENPATKLRVGISRNSDAFVRHDASKPPGMSGIREVYLEAQPGSQLVAFELEGQIPYIVASFASPNRGTLITLTLDDEGNFRVSQYLLPLGHLLQHLPEEVRAQIEQRNHLNDVRFLAEASRAFRKRRALEKEVSSDMLNELLFGKWLDPIASSMAAYELVRRGRKNQMAEVVSNMKRFFPDLPDTWALAKLNGEPIDRPRGFPVFFDGIRAFPDYTKWLPPAGNLDFASIWTAWRAVFRVAR